MLMQEQQSLPAADNAGQEQGEPNFRGKFCFFNVRKSNLNIGKLKVMRCVHIFFFFSSLKVFMFSSTPNTVFLNQVLLSFIMYTSDM